MADPRAGVGVVVAEHRAGEFLHQKGLLVGATARGDHADRLAAVFFLNPAQAGGGKADRLVPRDLAPGLVDGLADHRPQHPVGVMGIAPGKAALDAGMAPVRLAVLPRHHADQIVALQFGLERTADPAIGAGGHHRSCRLAHLDHRFFLQGRGRAGLHAGPTADAVRRQEIVARRPGRHPAVKAAPGDGQREGALDLFAGPHAARADDAFRRVIGEIRVRCVPGDVVGVGRGGGAGLEMVAAGRIADIAQADRTGHVLQFAIAIRRAGQTVERVVRDIELHHAAAQAPDPVGLGVHHHPLGHRRGAGGGRAAPARDLHQAQPAGAERLQAVGGAQLGDGDPGLGRGAHHAGAFGHGHRDAVNRQVDGHACARRRAHVAVVERYDEILHAAALRSQCPAAMRWQMPKSVTDFGPRSVPERAPGSFKEPGSPGPDAAIAIDRQNPLKDFAKHSGKCLVATPLPSRVMPPYLASALRRLSFLGYDPRVAGKRGWVSCWLPAMAQVASPPASEARLDR
jgi:hypothetical protein